jgi:hypothetical protein
LPIRSNLLVKPGTRRQDLRRVLSHPNALQEASVCCGETLATFSRWRPPRRPPFAFRYVIAAAKEAGVPLGRLQVALGPVPHVLVGAYAQP